MRQGLLHALPGYKGPDISSRGVDPEGEAFFYLDELADKIRQWIALDYHRTPHSSLIDPAVPGLRMSPAQMFAHGMARAGYIEVPRDRHLALEFLQTRWRTIQPYGMEVDGRRYDGPGLYHDGRPSPHPGGLWPIQVNPDDITRAYFRDLDRQWHVLTWEHAPVGDMPMSEDALVFARKLVAKKYAYSDDRMAVADLLERWDLGLGMTLAERRMALRAARDQAAFAIDIEDQDETAPPDRPLEPQAAGDDDAADFGDAGLDGEFDEEAFYADALGDL